MPIVDIRMSSEQMEGTESFVAVWLKKPGEQVSAHQPVVEISTDKVTVEIEAPSSGVLKEILKAENEPVAPGDVLGNIETPAEEAVSAPVSAPREERPQPPSPQSSSVAGDALTPAVRRLLKERNLDARLIPATGQGGRLTYQDVIDFLAKQDR